MYVALMTPLSRGRLTLRDSDPQSSLVIDTGYFTDPGDQDLAALLEWRRDDQGDRAPPVRWPT